MRITWLGQAGLLFEGEKATVMIDPYLSDSVKETEPQSYRRVPVDERFFSVKPDIIVLTHSHPDHADPETLRHFIGEDSNVTVLASQNAWQKVRGMGGDNNFVLFNRESVWTEKGIRFRAVHAEHSDEHAIGVILEGEGGTYYITGDTLYNERIFGSLPAHIDAVFLPVNGRGNNMNMEDGRRFCERTGAKAVPLHCGMFDDIDMTGFPYRNKVVPRIYEEIRLWKGHGY